jgi:hypothetical protein
MKHHLAFIYFILTSFFFVSNSMADSATSTTKKRLSVSIPEINSLNIPATVAIELTLDDDGSYSGTGQFSYSIMSNSAQTKRITASVLEPNFGDNGRLSITLREPVGQESNTILFQSGETGNKTVLTFSSAVAKKSIPLSIELKKLSAELVQPYITTDTDTAPILYPITINYNLSQGMKI